MPKSGWNQPLRYFFLAILLLLLIWFIYVAAPLLKSLIVAILIAYLLDPLVKLITRRTALSRTIAVNIVYLIFLSALLAIPVTLTPLIIRQVSEIQVDMVTLSEQFQFIMTQSLEIGNLTIPLDNMFSGAEELLNQSVAFILNNAFDTLRDITTNLAWILIVLVSVYYLLKDSGQLFDWILGLVPPNYKHHARMMAQETDDIWGNFLRGQLLLMLIIGILSWLGAVAVGLPGAFAVGVVAGVLDLIPSLGPTLAAIVAMIIALLEGSTYLPVSGFLFALIVLAVFMVIQQVENIWIRPALMGRRLRLHPALVLIGVFSALALSGILIALVIIPILATAGLIARYTIHRLQGIDPYPETPPLPAFSAADHTGPIERDAERVADETRERKPIHEVGG